MPAGTTSLGPTLAYLGYVTGVYFVPACFSSLVIVFVVWYFIWCRFSDKAVAEEAAEHQFDLIQKDQELSEAWFEIK